jgi:hypothetical protein
VRNKIEDLKVIPMYCETINMIADIGTKALEPARFELLRDAMTGYGLLEAWIKGKAKEFVSLMIKLKRKLIKYKSYKNIKNDNLTR